MKEKGSAVHEVDVLVIGGGAGGCLAAIKAKEFGADTVIQLDKGHVGKSGCAAFAAGILQAFCPEEDDYDQVFRYAVENWGYLVDQDRLRYHMEAAWPTVEELVSFGVEVEKTEDGKIQRYPGRGILKNVMFHGPQMMAAVAKEAVKRGVEQFHKTMMTDLLTKDGRVVGAVAFNIMTGDFYVFKAKATVISGGRLFKSGSPGGGNITGDTQVAAYRAGCALTEAASLQIHIGPAHFDGGPGMHMWVGTGGKFLNAKGERFMEKYFPDLRERVLLPFLVPCCGIEVRLGNGPIYLDMTHFTPEQVRRLKRVIPIPMLQHERVGNTVGDKFVKKIEKVANIGGLGAGGILVNNRFETSLPGLYAVGDAVPWAGGECGQLIGAFTGGRQAGECAAESAKGLGKVEVDEEQVQSLRQRAFQPMERSDGIEPDEVLLALQEAIFPYDVLLTREEGRMKRALEKVEDIRDNQVSLLYAYDPHYLRTALEARNMVTTAEIALRSAIFRKESRLGALREDYPYTDNVNWLKWASVKEENGGMKVFTQDLPIDRYPVKPPRQKVLHPVWQAAKDAGKINIQGEQVVWG